MKKKFKITGLILASLLLILMLLPFVFQGKITNIVLNQANKNLNAKVAFSEVSLSLIKNFPNATATVHDVSVTGTGAFEKDTLFYAKSTSATLNLMSLISGKEITVKGINLKSPRILAKVLEDGSANWDILPEGETSEDPE
ncbi:MAG: AsmA family protein, partial [Bacteroidales bacterium]|nr:AsmA family protein [Bacteroidales bacterium]